MVAYAPNPSTGKAGGYKTIISSRSAWATQQDPVSVPHPSKKKREKERDGRTQWEQWTRRVGQESVLARSGAGCEMGETCCSDNSAPCVCMRVLFQEVCSQEKGKKGDAMLRCELKESL